MALPGDSTFSSAAPAAVGDTELFAVDAYRRHFDADVLQADHDASRVLLSRTAFFPGGGGQPCDTGTLTGSAGALTVSRVKREGAGIWHWLAGAAELPESGAQVSGDLDWDRRHLVMRTHTALHILCGVIWEEFRIPVTGGNMEVGVGRLDFPLESMSTELGARIETRINEEIAAAHDIVVEFLGRDLADADPALIRTAANLIPREIDPLRIINIVGLDKQADGGTHVMSTAEVGQVRVTGTESKGKGNKRIRIAVEDLRQQ
ncbi:MAG: alanyl-tRNA editing protein [Nocardioidaceae bacterium]